MHRIEDQIDPNEEEYDMGQLNQLYIILLEAWTMSKYPSIIPVCDSHPDNLSFVGQLLTTYNTEHAGSDRSNHEY